MLEPSGLDKHPKPEVGEQVWVSYGGKSNAELLSQHLPFFRMVQGQISRIDAPKLSEPMLQGSEGCNKVCNRIWMDSRDWKAFEVHRSFSQDCGSPPAG